MEQDKSIYKHSLFCIYKCSKPASIEQLRIDVHALWKVQQNRMKMNSKQHLRNKTRINNGGISIIGKTDVVSLKCLRKFLLRIM